MCGNYSREETIQGRKLYEEIRYADREILTRIIPLALFDCKIATRATFQHLFVVWQYDLQLILDLGHLSKFSNSPKILFHFLKTANVKC